MMSFPLDAYQIGMFRSPLLCDGSIQVGRHIYMQHTFIHTCTSVYMCDIDTYIHTHIHIHIHTQRIIMCTQSELLPLLICSLICKKLSYRLKNIQAFLCLLDALTDVPVPPKLGAGQRSQTGSQPYLRDCVLLWFDARSYQFAD